CRIFYQFRRMMRLLACINDYRTATTPVFIISKTADTVNIVRGIAFGEDIPYKIIYRGSCEISVIADNNQSYSIQVIILQSIRIVAQTLVFDRIAFKHDALYRHYTWHYKFARLKINKGWKIFGLLGYQSPDLFARSRKNHFRSGVKSVTGIIECIDGCTRVKM